MKTLTPEEIAALTAVHPAWKLVDESLTREWTFKDFAEAMGFVNQVAALAERSNHHPDIDIRYNTVRLALVSHDAKGITRRDAAMIATLDESFPA